MSTPALRFPNVTFDADTAVKKANGGYVARRCDVAASERMYVALASDKATGVGFLQEFADGTAAYWSVPLSQAKSARSLDEAYEKLFVYEVTTSIMACPRCASPFLDEKTAKTGEEILVCKQCGAEAGKKWGSP